MFDKFKTRQGRLEHKVREELKKDFPDVENVLKAIDEYHKDNVNTIEKLKKDKKVEMNRINGALKQTINAHGPITKNLIGSASKRIYGSLIVNPNQIEKPKISIKTLFFGFSIGCLFMILIYLFL